MSEAPELMTTTQVAKRLGVTTMTVHRAVQLGYLRSERKLPDSGILLFDVDEVERYAQRRADADAAMHRLRSAH